MRARSILVALAATALLLLPATALARTTRVVPFRTVAGIPLKLTPVQVTRRLGKPSHVIRVSGKIAEYDYGRDDLSVEFDTLHHPDLSDFVGVVVGPATRRIDFRTTHGIHIGSSAAAVRRAFGCHIHFGQCTRWKGHPGAVGSTSFAVGIQNGRADQFTIQTVLNDL